MPKPTFVTGATGSQGGSVARRLLGRGRPVRALTRRASSPAAMELRALGAEIVEGDLGELATVAKAMRGCDAVFGVTSFWEHFGCEAVHGRNIVDAAVDVGVEQLVLSSLPSAEALSHGQISVPHFETKAAVESYAKKSGLNLTCVHVAFYFENFLSFFPPRPDAAGAFGFGFPQGDTPLAGVSVADLGAVLDRVFDDRVSYRGRTLGVVSEELTGEQYAARLSEVLGRAVRYTPVSQEMFAGLPFPGAEDLAAMFDLNRRFVPSRAADIASTHALYPSVQSFQAWADRHREAIARASA